MVDVQRLASHGCNIVLNGFGDATQIETSRASIEKQYGVQAIFVNADLKRESEIKSLVDQATKKFGGVDILVNNAGSRTMKQKFCFISVFGGASLVESQRRHSAH